MDAEGLKEGIGCMPMEDRRIEATWVAAGMNDWIVAGDGRSC